VAGPGKSDPVGNGGLHAIEEKQPAEKDESDSEGGSEKNEAGRLAVSGDGPAEAVNDASHGIETVKPAPAFGNERRRVSHRRSKHPELDEERNDVANVAIKSVQSRKPQAHAESGEKREKKKNGEPKSGKRRENAVSKTENGENGEANGEVDEAGKSGGDGENQAREIDFGDEALVVDDNVGGELEGVGEVGPGNESGEIENRIRQSLGWEFGEAAKKESEDEHGENGLENDPEDADDGLLVADLNVAPDEEVEELTVGPDFAKAKLEQAGGRLDADGADGGVERKRGGWWRCGDRSHARCEEAPQVRWKPGDKNNREARAGERVRKNAAEELARTLRCESGRALRDP